MKYFIEGRNLEVLRIELESEVDTLISEVGRMLYKSPGVNWGMTMQGEGFGGKVAASLRRRMAGEAALQCVFTGPGEVGFGGEMPGSIAAVEVGHDAAIVAQRGAFIAAEPTVTIGIAAIKKLKVNLFGGENLILQRLRGPGIVFLHAAGDFVNFDLGDDEGMSAEVGAMVYYDETVDYDIRRAGGLGTTLLGGEGVFLAHYTGPGRVSLQTMAHWWNPRKARK